MSVNCGIVGLPNVGKSTIFSGLSATKAEVANYAFCTIEPNKSIVNVPDARLDRINTINPAEKVLFATMEFVDIAGLVAGASKGEGLGNKFLANIRQTGMIAHVVRCFDDPDMIHVMGSIDPVRDIGIIDTELILADLETVLNRLEKNQRLKKNPDKKVSGKAIAEEAFLQRLSAHLEEDLPARALEISDDEALIMQELFLITAKSELLVCNVDEASINQENQYVQAVRELAKATNREVITLCGKLEAEISELEDADERALFLAEAGITITGLQQLSQKAYHMLNLRTFFTVGQKENRAWTFHEGDKAPRAAAVIHTDFEKGFIKAEVYHCEDLFALGSESAIKSKGKLRQEGKEYVVQDGDVIFFKFNL
ncbi:redox-regulated ATPase YchF [Entomospira culicis]|uniref:Ribosome-binding ATPase YchF n=2 Tax=Entomospira culicis TaxID=2719989 RepID=A0A968GEZ3_9SPIO|nr:redox-regulated ATPase YchF [Entomospira culicis]NIZ18395.1 redox-regulated ATPase YchF [Entomospira culicis]NIZ68611.1 redox-regulated ATPase YchF [Entomospira culicis]WDI37211.1 redox-regulated ATPase YchF [Entomospira culicis]WDI39602.1 redox-regulated ATPase YchF [Entomospira culicis]